MRYYLAVDMGASSGRHILAHVESGKIILEEVYRFENSTEYRNGHLCWNTQEQMGHILAGMKECKRLGKIPYSMGIDTWGVDFALLDEADQPVGDTVAYRDARTEGMDVLLSSFLTEDEHYQITGIQKQPFNTIYQLLALREQEPEQLDRAATILFLPEYFNFLLTGVKMTEYSIASTSAMLDAQAKTWSAELLRRVGLPERIFSREVCPPGTTVGRLTPAMQAEVGYDTTVILPPCHDTGSAFLAVPARDDNAVYISSGTWSLLGIESPTPIICHDGARANFTNEGGYQYRYRFLKNIMGLWMIQSIRRNLNKAYSFAQLEAMAKEAGSFSSIVDVNDLCFFAPESMIDAVKQYCEGTGQPVPATIGEVMQCVYRSLARCYADAIKGLSAITGRTFSSINIVGGGTKDVYLNALTADATGLPVYAGPTEGTALGNIMAQALADGTFADIASARAAIGNSFEILYYEPR